MNNKVIAVIITVFLLGFGGFYFVNSQRGNNGEDITGKPVAQSHRSYEIEVTSSTNIVKPQQPIAFAYKIKNDKGEVLKNYEVAHEKIMHFIAVRKDLQHFQHLHPEFNEATGEFTVAVTFPEDGPYRVFPDFTPGDDNPQKLPVTVYHDIEVGDSSKYAEQRVVPDSEQTKTYGDYKVATTFPKDVRKQQEVTYTLNIIKDGKPVTNLENYLGALGHSVILKERSLDFIHTHALESTSEESGGHSMNTMQGETATWSEPDIKFATTFPDSGVYKIFTQFQHEGKIQTVDYIVKVN